MGAGAADPHRADAWWAALLWLACIASLCFIATLRHAGRPAVEEYRALAQAWWQGRDLPGVDVGGLPAGPGLAILYTPFSILTPRLGETLWRVALALLFASAVFRLSRAAGGDAWRRVCLVASALSLPAFAPALLEGGAILAAAGLAGHAAADVGQRRWARGAACLAIAAAVAPALLAVCLLVAVVHPRPMSWRLGVAVLVTLVVPFVVQPFIAQFKPEYVLREYDLTVRDVIAVLSGRSGVPGDLTAAARMMRPTLSDRDLLILRAAVVLFAAGAAWAARWRWGSRPGWVLAMGVAAAMLAALNPGARGIDVLTLVPFWAALAAGAWLRDGRVLLSAGLSLLVFALGLAPMVKATWLAPVMAMLLGTSAIVLLLRKPTQTAI